ncbi:hypothetical protein FPOA_10838 [Fusarium poae]|uniref:Major facilitator superfamily (MFS) profile domain-containing protein n=1 Tax=Fusarium poae TaxID=36050 RepID=A0A1B8AF60_FUSPO|nr:hypothetical protein FPOA_10838 [Fusarium poae]
MNSVQRILSRVSLQPNTKSEPQQEPSLNEENLIKFRDGDLDNPENWSLARKRYVSAVAVLLSMNGNISSSIMAGSTQSVTQEFNVSRVATALTTSLFLLGLCAGPLVFCSLTEFYGRQCILYITFLLYFASLFLTAWPPNFGGLLVGRFIAGSFAAGPSTIVAGILADLWKDCACGIAMGIFTCASWVGPALGTVISGVVELKKDWHWGTYVCLWLAAFSLFPMFTIPETHSDTILSQKAKLARNQGYNIQSGQEASKPKLTQLYKIALTRPWMLLLDIISFLCCIYSCIIAALQYMLFSIYPIVFQEMRGWNAAVSQLPILGQAVGAFFALLIVLVNTKRRKRRVSRGNQTVPEDHMVLAMIGGIGFPISMLWLSWSAQCDSVNWVVPTIGGTVLSTCLMLIQVSCFSYVTDAYSANYTASVVAINIVILQQRRYQIRHAPLYAHRCRLCEESVFTGPSSELTQDWCGNHSV